MPDIEDGESAQIQGSAKDPYILRNVGGVYSCTCPAWRNQSTAIERRTCKHLRQYRGDEAETERLGGELPERAVRPSRPKTTTSGGTESGADDGEVPGILLAHSWKVDIDPTGWWMSEKLDGVRAYWDGKQFISRQGNVYMAPAWFTDGLPTDIHLDGELWLDRGAFQAAVGIVRRQDRSDHWKQISYVVFDAPNFKGTFEDRVAFVEKTLLTTAHSYARPHEHIKCQGIDHLQSELQRVQSLGGEGLMLRKAGSKYEAGRSMTLLKVKTFHDAEAIVVDHLPGTGKHKGRLGALSVKLPDGTVFSVGTGFTDVEREKPPAIGTIITFRYQELTDAGIPRFPSFVRVRTDLDRFESNVEKLPVAVSKLQTAPKSNASALAAQGGREQASQRTASLSSVATQIRPANEPPGTPEKPARTFRYRRQCYEFVWQILVDGCTATTIFKSDGQIEERKSLKFATPHEAREYAETQVVIRRNKGFIEL